MISAKGVIKLPLISITDGKMVGEIKDLYFDSKATKVVAALVDQKGFFSPKAMVVERMNIHLFGIDAWLVRGSDVVGELKEERGEPRLHLMDDLLGREVTTEGGTRIGTIGDVLMDGETNVHGFTLDKVDVKGPVAESKYLPLASVIDLGIRAMGLGARDRPVIVDLSQAEGAVLPE